MTQEIKVGTKLTEEKEVNKKSNKKIRGGRKEIDPKNIIDNTGTPIRQSRRIAQLKIREEAERRRMEEVALKKMKSDFKRQKQLTEGNNSAPSSQSDQEEQYEQDDENFKGKISKKKSGNEKKRKKDGWSSGSEEKDDEEEEQEHYYDSDKSVLLKSDHEFSPESDIEDLSQMVPLKRARTVRNEGENGIENSLIDEACMKCGKSDHPEWILLCDKCDKGYHCSCLSPVIFYIPEGLLTISPKTIFIIFFLGDWYCPPCQQDILIASLEKRLVKFDEFVLQKKSEEMLKLEEEKNRIEDILELNMIKKSQVKVHKQKVNNAESIADSDEEEKLDKSSSEDSSIDFRSTKKKTKEMNSDLDSVSSVYSDDEEPIYKLRKRRQINVSYRYVSEFKQLFKPRFCSLL